MIDLDDPTEKFLDEENPNEPIPAIGISVPVVICVLALLGIAALIRWFN